MEMTAGRTGLGGADHTASVVTNVGGIEVEECPVVEIVFAAHDLTLSILPQERSAEKSYQIREFSGYFIGQFCSYLRDNC